MGEPDVNSERVLILLSSFFLSVYLNSSVQKKYLKILEYQVPSTNVCAAPGFALGTRIEI